MAGKNKKGGKQQNQAPKQAPAQNQQPGPTKQ